MIEAITADVQAGSGHSSGSKGGQARPQGPPQQQKRRKPKESEAPPEDRVNYAVEGFTNNKAIGNTIKTTFPHAQKEASGTSYIQRQLRCDQVKPSNSSIGKPTVRITVYNETRAHRKRFVVENVVKGSVVAYVQHNVLHIVQVCYNDSDMQKQLIDVCTRIAQQNNYIFDQK